MPIEIPGTGRPDDEPTGSPHGDVLLTGSGLAVPAGGVNIPGIAGWIAVAAYRSLVVAINNTGANAVTVTPRWDFYSAPVIMNTETDVQTVAAGTSRRLIFQNQGDQLRRVRLAGVGGNTTVDYYVVGSNLDPLARSTTDWIYLRGANSGLTVATGILTRLEMELGFWTADASLWSFALGPGGAVNTVNLLKAGLYLVTANVNFGAPVGVYVKQLTAWVTVNVPTNYGNVNPLFGIAGANVTTAAAETTINATTQVPVNSGGGMAFNEGYQASGGPVAVLFCDLFIQRLNAVT